MSMPASKCSPLVAVSMELLRTALIFVAVWIYTVRGYDDNIALNRPSLKSYTLPGPMSGLSPDVMNNGNAQDGVCTGSTSPRAWMAIDLGQPAYVSAVHVTNTVTGTTTQKSYLKDFMTWLCSASPVLGSIVDTSVCSLCLQYPGAVVGTAKVCCSTTFPAYRYVVIQSAGTFVCVSEIEVYQDSRMRNGATGLFHRYSGHRLAGETTCTNYTSEARSQVECCALCRSIADCKSVNFRRQPRSASGELSCVPLASTLPIGADEQLINDVDWDWLYMDE